MILQLIVTGIVFGCKYALLAVSFGIIFKVTKTFHFAHASIYTVGAYFSFLLFQRLRIPLGLSLILGIIGATLAGWIVESLLYKPLRRINATHEAILIASLGLMIVIEMLIILFVGDGPQTVGYNSKLFTLGNIAFTSIQVYSVVTGVVLIVTLLCFLAKTKMGRTMEAVADNPELADLVGIGVDRIFNYAFLIGSGLAGVAAVLALLDKGIDPFAGTMPATMAFIAVIMGGVESILGGALAGFILGIAINLCVIGFSSEWQYLVTFLLVIILIIIRPQGLLMQRRG